jgi:RimJ/RimL family protein N-acetyltransferase
MRPQSARLVFRDMTADDLDDMAELLGDPQVMTYYEAEDAAGGSQVDRLEPRAVPDARVRALADNHP